MNARFHTMATAIAMAGALVAGGAATAGAQKGHMAGPHPMAMTHGMVKANEHAAKGQANAENRREDAAEDRSENAAERAVRTQRGRLLKGIKLTSAEKKEIAELQRKYDAQLKTLDKQEDAAEKGGKPDSALTARIVSLSTQERSDIRALLTAAQQQEFDKNASAMNAKH